MTRMRSSASQVVATIRRFIEFYGVLVEVKRQAATVQPSAVPRETPLLPAPAGAPVINLPALYQPLPEGESNLAALPSVVVDQSQHIEDIHIRLREAIAPAGRPPQAVDGIPDAGYAMAALADEMLLLCVDWPGRQQWNGMLLEEALYGTRLSGEELFTLGEGLASGEIPNRPDLAAAILLALCLGFCGRWRRLDDRDDVDDHGEIADLRRRLYEAVFHKPAPSVVEWRSVMTMALAPTLAEGTAPQLPRVGPWLGAIAASLVIGLSLGHAVWVNAVGGTVDQAERIIQYRQSAATR